MELNFELFGKEYRAGTFSDASAQFCAARDASGRGASTMPCPAIFDGGEEIGHFSYNGRIWKEPSRSWQPGSLPIYDNRAA